MDWPKGIVGAAALLLIGAAPAFNAQPWLEDLDQAQAAFSAKYANFEWAVFQRQADLSQLFQVAHEEISAAHNDAEAKAALDRFARHLGDGHVVFETLLAAPTSTAAGLISPPPDRCSILGYNADIFGAPLASHMVGYQALPKSAPEFPAGMITVGGRKIGVVKIGLFSPGGTPALCHQALQALNVQPVAPCDDACSDKVEAWASAKMTADLQAALEALKQAGMQTLLVDIAQNGGGSEWAEAAARMVTGVRLISERTGFVRGAHWIKKWSDLASDLRKAAKTANLSDRKKLMALSADAEAKAKIAATPCSSAPFWKGERPECDWLGAGGYATGLLGAADAADVRGKPWAAMVFSPAEYPYRESVWRGPLIVLVDSETWSAAEEFAATLQDNHAAVIIGAPTGGAGCGHTDGGTPTTLSHSHIVLELPDCVRFRANGDNEVVGVQPDVLVGLRRYDGMNRQAGLLLQRLPEAEHLAEGLSLNDADRQ